MKSFSSVIEKFQHQFGLHYVPVPEKIAKQFKGKFPIRIKAEIGNQIMQCALMKRSDGTYLIYLNIQVRKKLKLKIGDEISVILKPDDSEFGLDMPEELEVLLEQDQEGKEKFLALNPGTQRNIIYYISTAGREETRINRSIFMIERAKNGYWEPKRKVKS